MWWKRTRAKSGSPGRPSPVPAETLGVALAIDELEHVVGGLTRMWPEDSAAVAAVLPGIESHPLAKPTEPLG